MRTIKVDDRLLATHISSNPDFEAACMAGDVEMILAIVDAEMTKHNLHTNGAKKLREDVFRLTETKKRCSDILYFIWNSRLSGTGFAVI
jgi:hypothetical protein